MHFRICALEKVTSLTTFVCMSAIEILRHTGTIFVLKIRNDLLSMLGFLEVTLSNTQMRKCMTHRYSLLFDSNLLTHRIGLLAGCNHTSEILWNRNQNQKSLELSITDLESDVLYNPWEILRYHYVLVIKGYFVLYFNIYS